MHIKKTMKVSIITPVYNGEKTIEDCIKSINMQDYDNIEHIIVDGNSTDATMEIVNRYAIDNISEPDAGIYDAFNKGIYKASGDIIHILNSDDMYATASIVSDMAEHMLTNNLDLGHGYAEQINENGVTIKRIGKNISKSELLSKMRVSHPSTFIRNHVYKQFGTYSVGFRIAADHDFLLRVWDKINIGFLPLVTTKMRLGGASTSQVALSYKESMAATIIHGRSPIRSIGRYYAERLKNSFQKY